MPELTPERLEEIRSFLRWEGDWYHHQLLSHIDSLQAKVDAVVKHCEKRIRCLTDITEKGLARDGGTATGHDFASLGEFKYLLDILNRRDDS